MKRPAASVSPLTAPSGFDPQAFAYYRRLRRLERRVLAESATDISVSQAAAIVGLEVKYFSRFFRQKTGIGFADWINYVRIQRATELFLSSNYSVSEVSDEVGYGRVRTFRRNFKKYVGVGPSQFKKSVVRRSPQLPA